MSMSLAKKTEPVLVVKNLDPKLTAKVLKKLFGKYGQVLSSTELPGLPDGEPGSRAVRVEFDSPEDAAFAKDKLDGKKALSKKLVVLFEKDSRLVSDKEKIKSLEAKLTKLEQGVDFEAEAGRMGKAKNTQMFSHNGKGQAIWNGMGTTKTKQSPTLFITNIPRGKINELDTVFKLDPGFFRVRVVRHMAFVDYETVADATRAMIKHQNERMPGISLEHGGIMIDFDKDSRNKRNRAYERSRNDR